MTILSIILLVIAVLGVRALWVVFQRPRYKKHWYELMKREKKQGDFHLLVLGDSIMQGIGASRLRYSLAGRVAHYVELRTGKNVYIENRSLTGGKVRDVAQDQIPQADIDSADLIIVTVSANDALRKTPIAEYRDHLQTIADSLPANKTILADVPRVGLYSKYQPAFDEVVGKHPYRRASFYDAEQSSSMFSIIAGDFFHPNNKGYQIWFSAFKPHIDDFLSNEKT